MCQHCPVLANFFNFLFAFFFYCRSYNSMALRLFTEKKIGWWLCLRLLFPWKIVFLWLKIRIVVAKSVYCRIFTGKLLSELKKKHFWRWSLSYVFSNKWNWPMMVHCKHLSYFWIFIAIFCNQSCVNILIHTKNTKKAAYLT